MTEERSRRVVGGEKVGNGVQFKGKWKVGEWKEAVVSCETPKNLTR
jgi:hypothetical protein